MNILTPVATERCLQEKRKTITGEDIIAAMNTLGFENYGETLKLYIDKFREVRVRRLKNSNHCQPDLPRTKEGGDLSGPNAQAFSHSANAPPMPQEFPPNQDYPNFS